MENESLTWNHSDSRFQFSDDLHIVGNITVTGNVDGIDISAIDTDDVSEMQQINTIQIS